MSPTPDRYRYRDLAILRLVGTYGVVVQAAVSQVLFDGKPSGHVLRRLAEEELLAQQTRKLEGGITFFRLTEKGAKRVGVPLDRTVEAIGVQALDKAIATLVWCTLGRVRRYRLERGEVEAVFGQKPPTNQVHVIAGENPTIQRVSLVQGSHEPVIKVLRQEIQTAKDQLRLAIEAGQYGFVLLTESGPKQKSVDAAIERSGLRETATISVEPTATTKSLAGYLRGLRKATAAT